jgi:hypothetical protein
MTGDPSPAGVAVRLALPLLTLAFAALSLGVARRTPPPLAAEAHRAAWRLTGAAFAVCGAHALAAALASWAGVSLPDGDAVRAPLLLVYGVALLRVVWRPGAGWGTAAWLAPAAALLPGTTAPWWRGWLPLAPATMAVAAGVAQAAAVVLLLAVLLAALLRDAVDQLLWVAVALFALRTAAGAGLPPLRAPALSAAVLAAMVALAARRLALARRGARVPPLLEPLWPRMRPAR